MNGERATGLEQELGDRGGVGEPLCVKRVRRHQHGGLFEGELWQAREAKAARKLDVLASSSRVERNGQNGAY